MRSNNEYIIPVPMLQPGWWKHRAHQARWPKQSGGRQGKAPKAAIAGD
jgi:hypothetical protein